jgi:hypothetical protein
MPSMTRKMTYQGMFGFYAAWNLIGFFLVLLYVSVFSEHPLWSFANNSQLALCRKQKVCDTGQKPAPALLTEAGRSLEELDRVFSVSTRKQVTHGLNQAIYCIKRWVLRDSSTKSPVLVVPGDAQTEPFRDIPLENGPHRPPSRRSSGSWS